MAPGRKGPLESALSDLARELAKAADATAHALEEELDTPGGTLAPVAEGLDQVMASIDGVVRELEPLAQRGLRDADAALRTADAETAAQLRKLRAALDARHKDVMEADSSTDDDLRQGAAQGAAEALESTNRHVQELSPRLRRPR